MVSSGIRDRLLGDRLLADPDAGLGHGVGDVVGETFDGDLNDINGMHVRAEHVHAALAAAAGGAVAEGGVGSGTGM
ncbi:MAG: P1 family peptidase, partial [Actinomycetes bacterium]